MPDERTAPRHRRWIGSQRRGCDEPTHSQARDEPCRYGPVAVSHLLPSVTVVTLYRGPSPEEPLKNVRWYALAGLPALLLAMPAHAGSPPGTARYVVQDAAGDWAVPMQDVVTASAEAIGRGADAGAVKVLRLTAGMSSALTGAPGDYDLILGGQRGTTCRFLAVRVRWSGVAVTQAYSVQGEAPCSSDSVSALELAAFGVDVVQTAVGGAPVDAASTPSGVVATIAAPAWLRRGTQATFTVFTHPPVTATIFGVNGTGKCTCDFAYRADAWRVS